MKPVSQVRRSDGSKADTDRVFERVLLRLVKGGKERSAIAAGEVDAVLDAKTGGAILLPAAQRALFAQDGPHRRTRATLDALSSHVSIVDSDGVVLFANKPAREFATLCDGLAGGIRQGANYLAVCEGADESERLDGMAIAAGLRQIIAGERAIFRYELPCTGPAGRCWFAVSITAVGDDAAARAVIACEDVTAHKRGESLLALRYRVARTLAGAESESAAVTRVIRLVCESEDWDCGRYFRHDEASGTVIFAYAWGTPGAAVETFLAKSHGLQFRLGAGLTGRVCLSGQPLWVLDGASGAQASSAALAPEIETDSAFVIPVIVQDKTIGVLAFSNRTFCEPDDRMLAAVESIGSQLGQFLKRQAATDELRRSEAHFRKTTEVSSDWHWEQNSQFQFTQFAGSGIPGVEEYLGKTHWELVDTALSEAAWTEHRLHLAAHWSFCDFEFAARHPDGQLGYYSINGEPVFDEVGTFVGYCGTGLDITARRRAEDTLRDGEARLRESAGPAAD